MWRLGVKANSVSELLRMRKFSSIVVSGLAESTTYYFVIKAVDDTQTWSALVEATSMGVERLEALR